MSSTIDGLLIESSLRALLLAAVVGACLAVLRVRASHLRHAAWTAVLAGMVLMPLLPRIVPTFAVAIPDLPRGGDVQRVAPAERVPPPDRAAPSPTPAASQLREPSRRTAAPAAGAFDFAQAKAAIGLGVYVSGLLVLLLRTSAGWRRATRLIAASEPIAPRELPGIAWRRHDIRESSAISVPLVVGWIKPAIMLPMDWRRWTDVDLRAVLSHELAHLARRDPLVAALAHTNACIFWFHPLSWWLKQHLAMLAERACDDTGVREVGDRQAYAETLIRMAARARRSGGRMQPITVGIDGHGPLTQRIDRVLRLDLSRPSRLTTSLVVAACAAAIGSRRLLDRRRPGGRAKADRAVPRVFRRHGGRRLGGRPAAR